MERDVEEGNKRRNHESIVTNPDWLDLPEPIATNIILEHLDLVDYIRFSAVCKKWQSIQKEHKIGYSPYPPPLPLPFPWLRCVNHYLHNKNGMASCFYQPSKQKSYNIPLYETAIEVHASGYKYGWLLHVLTLGIFCQSISILNPITGVQIEIPMIHSIIYAAHISSPPTDPDCTILVLDIDENVYLYRPNDNNGLIKTDYSINSLGTPIFFHNKIYYLTRCKKLCIVDALLPDPVERIIKMDCSEICVDLNNEMFDLVDFLGVLVMVVAVYDELLGIDYDTIKEFHVYKADFSTNKWVRMESLGDHALFFSYESIFCLPAAVDVGCKKNTIYSKGGLKGSGVAWRAFDVSTKNWFDGPRMSLPSNDDHSDCNWSWFLPSLDYYHLCQNE